MLHPILSRRQNIIYYSLVWIAIFAVHASVINIVIGYGLCFSFADAFINEGLFYIFGIGIWYLVRYTNLESQTTWNIVRNLVLGGFVIVLILNALTFGVLSAIYSSVDIFTAFLQETIHVRITFAMFQYFALVSFYYMINYYNNFNEKLKDEIRLKNKIKEAELTYLKSQINPHFLFNALNSISSLTVTNPEKAQEMVVELSDYLRMNMSFSKKKIVTFGDELKNIERYLGIEKIRYGDRMSIKGDVPQDCYSCFMPPLILQPLFENAVKYGLHESVENMFLEYSASLNKYELIFVLRNSYETDAQVNNGTGNGIKNVEERLKLMYGRVDLVKIIDSNNIFEMQITIPQIKKPDVKELSHE